MQEYVEIFAMTMEGDVCTANERMRGKNLSIGHGNSYSQSHSHRQR